MVFARGAVSHGHLDWWWKDTHGSHVELTTDMVMWSTWFDSWLRSWSLYGCEVPGSKIVRGHRLRQLLLPSQSFIVRVRVSTVSICLDVCFMISGPFDLICKNRCFVIEKCRDWSSCHQLIFVLEFRSIWHATHDMVQPDSSVGKSTHVQNGRSVVQAPKWLFFRKHKT